MLSKTTDKLLVDLYRGWDELEKSKYNNPIIDFDLAPGRDFPRVSDRREVLQMLESMAAEFENETEKSAVLVHARLIASATYLRALLGERVSFRDYIKRTLGIEPRFFPEEVIARQREIVRDILWDNDQIKFEKRELSRSRGRFRVYDVSSLRETFRLYHDRWVPVLL